MDKNILLNNGIDLNKSLELFGDMATYNQMLKEFLSEAPNKLKQAKSLKEQSNMSEYAVIVHSLKSDCKYFGIFDLADMFYKHELAGKENDFYFVNNNFDELEKEANRMLNVLRQYMGESVVSNEVLQSPVQLSNIESQKTDLKILVVDDSDIVRNFIQKIFATKYNVLLAKDGQEAISILATTPREKLVCMLLDLNMPNINGFTVLDYMSRNDLLNHVPVSIITGANDNASLTKAQGYPIVSILQKPFNEATVKKVVMDTIARKS